MSIKRDIFPLPFAICDLDSDGKDDLIAENSDPDTHMWSVAVAYGTVDGWASPVDVTKSVMTGVMGNAPRVTCWPNSYAPGKFLVSDPGSLTSQGFLADGTVWFYDVDANQAPLLTKTLVNFDPNTNLSGFGKDLVPAGDYNGDGKPDLIIGYQAGFGGLTAAWLLYGR